jgi:anti-sigma B factor antagonist
VTASSVATGTSDLVTIEITGDSATTVLTAAGEIDSSSAPTLRSRLDAVLDDGVQALTIDLRQVTFLDSAGLCVLAAAHRRAVREGRRLSVLATSRAVVRPMQITGLYALLDVAAEESGAA